MPHTVDAAAGHPGPKGLALILGLFCSGLVLSLVLHVSLLWALAFGYGLFFVSGLALGHGTRALVLASLEGVRQVAPILVTFLFIGLLMASWRACGAIAHVVVLTAGLIPEALFLPGLFLLNALVSLLMGSSFATAATMGAVCMSMARGLQADPVLAGGAILAGCYFGDRCSPLSTSAMLVAAITGTDLRTNLRNMWRSARLPLVLALLASLAAGLHFRPQGLPPDVAALFGREYVLDGFCLVPVLLVPALLVPLLVLGRSGVRLTMGVSTLAAVALCLWQQDMAPAQVAHLLVAGFRAQDPEVAALMDGGGLVSMLGVCGIVCLSSSYAGLFHCTGMLKSLGRGVRLLADRFGAGCAHVLVATLCSALACNQTLAILMTGECTRSLGLPPARQALHLEDSAVVIAALLPWSIACAVPLTSIGAPVTAIFAAFYLWFLPLRLVALDWRRGRARS